jgi:hypothetical protein
LVTARQLGVAWASPSELAVGAAGGEAPVHFWSLWLASENLWRDGPFVRFADIDWPLGFRSHLMDPVNLLVFAPIYHLFGRDPASATLAWNALHALAPLLGGLAIWTCSTRLYGRGPWLAWAALLLGVVLLGSPFWQAYPKTGRTEFLPAMLLPLHVALLHRWMRRLPAGEAGISPPPPWWVGACCAGVLALVALGGWYLVVFVGALDVALGLWWSRGLRLSEAAARLLAVSLPAALPLVPAAKALIDWGSPLHTADTHAPWGDISVSRLHDYPLLASFRLVTYNETGMLDYPAYLGFVAGLFALGGAWRWRREVAPWVVIALCTIGLGIGDELDIGGDAQWGEGWPTPLGLLCMLVPQLRGIHAWARLMLVGSFALAVATGLTLRLAWPRLGDWGPRLASVLCVFCWIDQASYPTAAAWPPASFRVAPPAAMLDAAAVLPPGAILGLPFDIDYRRWASLQQHGKWLWYQLALRRPVSARLFEGREDRFAYTTLGVELKDWQRRCALATETLCSAAAVDAAPDVDIADDSRSEILAFFRAAWVLGYAGAILDTTSNGGAALREPLHDLLGAPDFDRGGVVAWDLRVRADVREGAAELFADSLRPPILDHARMSAETTTAVSGATPTVPRLDGAPRE